MVKSKAEAEDNVYWLDRVLDDIERRHPIIETRFYVVEVTPRVRYNRGDGHGGTDYEWTDEVNTKVSPYFKTKKGAVNWMNDHVPDEGKTLSVMKQNKRRTIEEKWWSSTKVRV